MEPQKCVFNPFVFLAKPEELSDYECIICTQKSIRLVRCKTCKNCLCNQCAIDQKQINDKCPYRCSTNSFQVQPVEINLQFYCPFSQKCKKIIDGVKQFIEHDRSCEFISQQQKKQQTKKWQFRCHKNHSLQVYTDSFLLMTKRKKCASCGNVSICRAICRKCDQFYCPYCRPFPIYEGKCPIGHKFKETQKISFSNICDSCQLIPRMTDIKCYQDYQCNMDYCGVCFRNWPAFEKEVQNCQNLNNYCEVIGSKRQKEKPQYPQIKDQHMLILLQKEVKQICSWCEKQKLCYKKCQKCVKYYCFKCKILDVLPGHYCTLGHSFIILDELDEENIKNYAENQCYSCRKKQNQNQFFYLVDVICKIILCGQCLDRCRKFNYDVSMHKIDSLLKYCTFDKKHILLYRPLGYKVQNYCSICKEEKIVKFICNECEQVKGFCCECIQTQDPSKCYCGKQLMNKIQPQKNMVFNCSDCGQQNLEQIYQCVPCHYGICINCISKRKQKLKIQ